MDESSPQNKANTQRLWSTTKPAIKKNTSKMRANTFGFYSLNGESLVDFKPHSRKEDVCEFLELIRKENPAKEIVIQIDNFPSHWAKKTRKKAEELDITLIFQPPYSPDLNPIEYIWKSIKREISPLLIKSEEELKNIVKYWFNMFSKSLSFAKGWIQKFSPILGNSYV